MSKPAIVRKCPVCGSNSLQPCGQYMDQLRCMICGTADSVNQFPVVGNLLDLVTTPKLSDRVLDLEPGAVSSARSIDRNHMAFNHLPPQEIQDALTLIERFFASRNVKQWAFGSIQSRNADSILENALRGASLEGMFAAPTLDREQLAIYASAFRCVMVPRATMETIDKLAKMLCDFAGCDWAFADEQEKMRCRDIVIELLQAVGVY